MNKQEILSLLNPFITNQLNIDDGLLIDDISSNLQTAKSNQVVFYRLFDTRKSEEMFKERLCQAETPLLILNQLPHADIELSNVIIIPFEKFYDAQKCLLDVLYPYFADRIKIAGITGTNGKTTTVNLAMQIAEALGHRSLSIGTLGLISKDGIVDETVGMTTPSYIELRKMIGRYQDDYDAIFFEASSHALDQGRLFDFMLDAAGWTSFSQDHLDYHKDMDSYFDAKSKVVSSHLKEGAELVIPSSELQLCSRLKEHLPGETSRIKLTATLENRGYKELPLFFQAAFNQSNLEVALQVNENLWGSCDDIDLTKLSAPKGRFEPISVGENIVIIDYAHTPNALENILKTARATFSNYKINVLFGCGGDRDPSKRKVMGELAEKLSDRIFLTSDNPRGEDQASIIDQIVEGIKDPAFVYRNIDREVAIVEALEQMDKNEVLIIAGKGHEEYQEIAGKKRFFSDFHVVDSWVKGATT